MHAMSDISTAQLAFLAFAVTAIVSFGIILLEVAVSAILRASGKRAPAPSKTGVTAARRPSRR